jgi:hypothetical protein
MYSWNSNILLKENKPGAADLNYILAFKHCAFNSQHYIIDC